MGDRLHGKVDVEKRRWNQVMALAEELGLDDRARNVVSELPAMEAYKMLQNCKDKLDSVKNPSAYVLKGVAVVQKEMDPSTKRRRCRRSAQKASMESSSAFFCGYGAWA